MRLNVNSSITSSSLAVINENPSTRGRDREAAWSDLAVDRRSDDHAVLPLQEARGNEALARRPTRRYRSHTCGQTIRLTVPVSSSSVMNVIPLAVPGRCLTRTSPATR